jgi:chemotaxis signal transduction protein
MYLLFTINNNYYAISTNLIREITKFQDFTYVPKTNTLVDGIIKIRNTIASVIDLRRILYDKVQNDGHFIVVKQNSKLYAFGIDNVLRIVNISDQDLEDVAIPIMINNKKFQPKVGKYNEILFYILDNLIEHMISQGEEKINH